MIRLLRSKLRHRFGVATGFPIPEPTFFSASAATTAAATTAAASAAAASAAAAATAIASKESSLTISFLKNSCGLSAAAAASIAQRLRLRTTDNPRLILALLRDFGFSDADISRLVVRHPHILNAKPDKTVRPKLEFYHSMGLAGAELSRIISSSPWSLLWSLEKRLIPSFDVLKSFVHTNEKVISTLRNTPYLLLVNLKKVLPPKIESLRAYGVSEPVIELLLVNFAKAFIPRIGRFEEAFALVKEIGLNPTSSIFAKAFGVFGEMAKDMWKKKLENFHSIGWSDDQVLTAFARHPHCMGLSLEKLRKNMGFLADKVKYGPECVSLNPVLLSLSLEKRIIPRFMVLQVLMSKGSEKNEIAVNRFLISEEKFMRKYVIKNLNEAPEVLDAIKGTGMEVHMGATKDSEVKRVRQKKSRACIESV